MTEQIALQYVRDLEDNLRRLREQSDRLATFREAVQTVCDEIAEQQYISADCDRWFHALDAAGWAVTR